MKYTVQYREGGINYKMKYKTFDTHQAAKEFRDSIPMSQVPCLHESKPGFVWLGNQKREKELEKGFKTLCIGSQAFDWEGNPLTEAEGYVPLFIHESEYLPYSRTKRPVYS